MFVRKKAVNGIREFRLESWEHFTTVLIERVLDWGGGPIIWRGQSSASWALESSFDRAVRRTDAQPTEELAQRHLERFKRATRGRRSSTANSNLSDDEWWTLGQHYGLATPMLDWTYSPYVALYFAFLDNACADPEGTRAVWAMHMVSLEWLNMRAASDASSDVMQFRLLDPFVDENARLVNQNGIFTRGPVGMTLDGWTRKLVHESEHTIVMVKFSVNGEGRENCLRHLNQMNINHVTLFPDLEGASRHCNHQLLLADY
jgi:hypothetical protein